MIVRNLKTLKKLNQIVEAHDKSFISNRFLLKSDGLGYTVTKTVIPKSDKPHIWHYKNHLESCYCVRGKAIVHDFNTGVDYEIEPDTLYSLNQNEKHSFHALEDTILICVFNPPLNGNELHRKDFSYE